MIASGANVMAKDGDGNTPVAIGCGCRTVGGVGRTASGKKPTSVRKTTPASSR